MHRVECAEFWANSELLADRSAPSQECLKELLKGLAVYVKQHHAARPAWNLVGALSHRIRLALELHQASHLTFIVMQP